MNISSRAIHTYLNRPKVNSVILNTVFALKCKPEKITFKTAQKADFETERDSIKFLLIIVITDLFTIRNCNFINNPHNLFLFLLDNLNEIHELIVNCYYF